ncbi:hypothetical protein FOA52_008928 [Chlamydomonas sp. UWO 241]|nr:hypothetical protein FOA52_008928 [Chlamydomonas sp. UWO 241]
MASRCSMRIGGAPIPAVVLRRSVAAPAPHAVQQQRPGARGLVCRAAPKVSDLPGSLQKIVGLFQMVPDPMARYKQLLFYAAKLEALPADDHVPENKVEGCVSQVWVKPDLRSDGKVYWRADSDSQLTKGLAALLVQGLSGCTPQEIITTDPVFIEMLGLKQSLTPSRNNGFLNMFRLMQKKTLALMAGPSASAEAPADGSDNGGGHPPSGRSVVAAARFVVLSAESQSATPLQDGMRRKLGEALSPTLLSIVDESSKHSAHAAARSATPGKPGGSGETHFKVTVVSGAFDGMSQVKRQRWIYSLLADEFGAGLHALTLITKTPAEAEV